MTRSEPAQPSRSGAAPEDFHSPVTIFGGVLPELEILLRPVSEVSPAGEDLRYDPVYDKIKEARREEDAGLSRGVWERKLKRADWPRVISLCTDTLTNRTKDLQITLWLMEALMRLHSFHGLLAGMQLLRQMTEEFWDVIHPRSEDDDLESRIFPFFWLNEKLVGYLKILHLTRPKSADHSPYAFVDWERANLLENRPENPRRTESEEESLVTITRFKGSMAFTSLAFYRNLVRTQTEIIDEVEQLTGFLDEKCGQEAPSLNRFRDTLMEIMRLSTNFRDQKAMEEGRNPQQDEDDAADRNAHAQTEDSGGTPFLTIRNRAEAYRMLSEAADYLQIHEPHSPTPYLVKRAVTWGHMPLEKLLTELVNDESDLKQIFRLLGIQEKTG